MKNFEIQLVVVLLWNVEDDDCTSIKRAAVLIVLKPLKELYFVMSMCCDTYGVDYGKKIE